MILRDRGHFTGKRSESFSSAVRSDDGDGVSRTSHGRVWSRYVYGRSTAWYPVPAHPQTTNILVAGMRASSTYRMRSLAHCVNNNAETVTCADTTFTTRPLPGALPGTPSCIAFPTLKVTRPNSVRPSVSSRENPG
jgi:hypothetical protein